MEKYHVIYIYISRGKGYSYSIIIENHYRLVIDLWCRYLGKTSYDNALAKAVLDALKEYFEMGLAETPLILVLPDVETSRKLVSKEEFKELIKPFNEVKISFSDNSRYRRIVELARHCLKNRLERYPPSKLL